MNATTKLLKSTLVFLILFVSYVRAEEFDVQLTPSLYAGGYNFSCHGAKSGSINLFISGGTAPYTYVWSDGLTIRNRSNMTAGFYSVVVTSASGQSLTREITLTEPGEFQVNIDPVVREGGYNISQYGGSDGTISADVVGGVPPYTFLWSNGTTAQNIDGLIAGTYTLIVHDATNCTASSVVTLTEPSELHVVSISSPKVIGNYNISCASWGSINLVVAGGTPPYSFDWSNGAHDQDLVHIIEPGTYSVEISDANTENTRSVLTASITLTKSPELNATITPFVYSNTKNTTCYNCYNGIINTAISTTSPGVSPYTFTWNNGSFSQNPINLGEGSYSVVIKDAAGCSIEKTASILAPQREDWTMNGNSNIDSNQFIGTTDAKDLVLKTNGVERLKLLSNGSIKLHGFSNTGDRFLKISSNGTLGISSPNVPWETRGNNFINSSDYIGTINNSDFIVKTNTSGNGGERMRFTSDGHITISNFNQVSDNLFTISGNTKVDGNIEIAGVVKLSSFNLTAPELIQIGVNGELTSAPFPSAALINYWNKSSLTSEINYFGKVGISTNIFNNGETFHVNGGSWFDGAVNMNGNINFGSFTNTADELIKVDASHNLSSIPFSDINYWEKTTSSIGTGSDVFYADGAVGIGLEPINFTSLTKYKLLVNGSIGAKEVVIRANGPWPDYVFEKDYELKKLSDVENFITNYKHLPDMPNASEIETNGQSIAEIQKLQQQKIEELYLYVLQQKKEIDLLKKLINR